MSGTVLEAMDTEVKKNDKTLGPVEPIFCYRKNKINKIFSTRKSGRF